MGFTEELMSTPLLMVSIVASLGLYLWYTGRNTKLPPGPKGLPLIGNIHQMDNDRLHNTLLRWAREHGEMFTFYLFRKPVVVISGKDAIKEALVNKSAEFADRPQSFMLQYMSRGGKAIAMGNFCDEWQRQKKLTSSALRMYGDGLQKLEAISQKVLKDFTTHLNSTKGQALPIKDEVRKAIINVITSLVFGRSYPWDHPDFVLIDEALHSIPAVGRSSEVLNAFPWLRHIVPLDAWTKLKFTVSTLDGIISRQLKAIEETYDSKNLTCFAEAVYQQTMDENFIGTEKDYDQFVMTIFGTYIAGFTTTSTALTAFILITLHYPEVEKKLAREIEVAIGRDNLPCLEDKKKMPYLEACILETLRYISHAPFAVPHSTSTDVDFRGYHIPKGTMVFINLYQLHHDEKEWVDPWVFRPERFIDPDSGDVFYPGHPVRQGLMPFGAGRRVCVGEVLAKNRLFLFTAGLFQKFRFLLEEGATLPPCDTREWSIRFITHIIPDLKLRAVPRHL